MTAAWAIACVVVGSVLIFFAVTDRPAFARHRPVPRPAVQPLAADTVWMPRLPAVPPPARSAHVTDWAIDPSASWLADQPTEVLLSQTQVNRICAEMLAIEGLS